MRHNSFENSNQTYTYIAKPADPRCKWWCIKLGDDLTAKNLEHRYSTSYLCAGADLELKDGEMLLTSEERHHSKQRGYNVNLNVLSIAPDKQLSHTTFYPNADVKKYIKENGGQDLMEGSGDVIACIRLALWLRRQQNLRTAIETLMEQNFHYFDTYTKKVEAAAEVEEEKRLDAYKSEIAAIHAIYDKCLAAKISTPELDAQLTDAIKKQHLLCACAKEGNLWRKFRAPVCKSDNIDGALYRCVGFYLRPTDNIENFLSRCNLINAK